MKECRQINQEVRREFERARDMVDRLLGIITHDERIGGQWPGAMAAPFSQARSTCTLEMGVIHNEQRKILTVL